MHRAVVGGLVILLFGASACSSSQPTLADELSQESLSRIEDAPAAPAASAVGEVPLDAPAVAPTRAARPSKKFATKKKSSKKHLAKRATKRRKSLSRRE